jgi:hypothetical protein
MPDTKHEKPQQFYIQDARSYVGDAVVWWRPDGKGYTCDLSDAGIYSLEEVLHLRETDVPWPRELVDSVVPVKSVYITRLREVADKASFDVVRMTRNLRRSRSRGRSA